MKMFKFLSCHDELLTQLNSVGYGCREFYQYQIYQEFLYLRASGMSVKATLLTMQQNGYGSISSIKRIRRMMEREIE